MNRDNVTIPTPKPGERARVIHNSRTENYWKEQGWKLKGYRLEGYYRTMFGSFRGYIQLFDSGIHQYYICELPQEIKYHQHGPCFMARGNGLYWIHFAIEPDCVDTGITTIEKIIREARQTYQLPE